MVRECPGCLAFYDDALSACPLDGAALEQPFEGAPVLDRKYRLERRLGRGGMGSVYKVVHLGLQRAFALKLIRPNATTDARFFARFRIEAEALGRLKHPNIVDVSDFGIDPRSGGIPYLVMEYLEGEDLGDYCELKGALPPEEALPLLEAIARGIDFAHGQGILHRDLKPKNVLVVRGDSRDPQIRIVDFGLARLAEDSDPRPSTGSGRTVASDPPPAPSEAPPAFVAEARLDDIVAGAEDTTQISGTAATVRVNAQAEGQAETELLGAKERLTRAGAILGTVRYIAPEMLTGAVATRASDIYAFGVLIFEVLVGRAPFEGATGQVIIDHVKTNPPVPSTLSASVPPELDAALLAALHKDPASRPARATDVVDAIRGAWQRVELRNWKAREIPRRAGFAVGIGLAVALVGALSGNLGVMQRAESWTIDSRFGWRPARPPDPRLALVALDDETLADEQATLTDRADEFGQAMQRVFAAGARAVAVDMLFPARWSRSKPFADVIVKHADRLTLAALSTSQGKLVGPEAISPLVTVVLGPQHVSEIFGYVNLDPDPDGILRRARATYTDQTGRERDAFAGRAVRTLVESIPAAAKSSFIIDFSIDWTRYRKVSWKDLPARLDKEPEWFRDRLVLVGAEFSGGGDLHRVPNAGGHLRDVSGMTVQALIADTLLAGLPIRETGPRFTLLCFAPCLILVGMSFLCVRGWYVPAFLAAALTGIYVVAGVVLFRWHGVLVPLVAPVTAVLGTVALSWTLRSRLAPFPGGAP